MSSILKLSEKRLHFGILAALGLLIAYLFSVAARLEVDYLDSYRIFLNARTIVAGEGVYNDLRTVFSSFLYAPLFWIEKIFGVENLAFRLSHLFVTLCFVGLLFTLRNLFRRSLSPFAADVCVFLFAFTPIIIHYAPISKVDLPALLLLTLSLLLYLEGMDGRPRLLSLSAIFVGAAVAFRYNFGIFYAIFFPADFLRRSHSAKNVSLSTFAILAGGALITLLVIPLLVYPHIGRASAASTIPTFLKEIWSLFHGNRLAVTDAWLNYRMFGRAFTSIFVFFAAFGLLRSWRQPKRDSGVYLLWFFAFFLSHTYFLSGREIRFLFPAFPPFVFLAWEGLEEIRERLSRFTYARVVALGVFFLTPLVGGIAECVRFSDPFYFSPFAKRASAQVMQISSNDKIHWLGPSWGSHPNEYVFDRSDFYAYVYHFHPDVLRFYTPKKIERYLGWQLIPRKNKHEGYWLPEIGRYARDRDLLLLNLSPLNERTENVIAGPPAMLLQRARLRPYVAGKVADGEYEIYEQDEASESLKSRGFMKIKNGRWHGAPLPKSSPGRTLMLLDFDEIRYIDWNFGTN